MRPSTIRPTSRGPEAPSSSESAPPSAHDTAWASPRGPRPARPGPSCAACFVHRDANLKPRGPGPLAWASTEPEAAQRRVGALASGNLSTQGRCGRRGTPAHLNWQHQSESNPAGGAQAARKGRSWLRAHPPGAGPPGACRSTRRRRPTLRAARRARGTEANGRRFPSRPRPRTIQANSEAAAGPGLDAPGHPR